MKRSRDEEAEKDELYDRQLRLWGVQVQQRIGSAKILICGVTGTSAEVCKNLVLSGVEAVTLVDDQRVTEADLAANFFLSKDDIGLNRAEAVLQRIQALNPHVRVAARDQNPFSVSNLLDTHDLVFASAHSLSSLICINKQTREKQRPMFGLGCFGVAAFVFADLLNHKFQQSSSKENQEGPAVEMELPYVPLLNSLECQPSSLPKRAHRMLLYVQALHMFETNTDKSPDAIKKCAQAVMETATPSTLKRNHFSPDYTSGLLEAAGVESSPVASILGGLAAQQAIRVISLKDPPMQNWLLYDSSLGGAVAQNMGCGDLKKIEA